MSNAFPPPAEPTPGAPVSGQPDGAVPPPRFQPRGPILPPPAGPAEPKKPQDYGFVLAAVWLGCSVIVGLWLAFSSHAIASNNVKYAHVTSTGYSSYGGDAYTGIQNAAVDTANSVEELGSFEDANSRIGRRIDERSNLGLAFLIISVGVVNFNIALRRKQSAQAAEAAATV